MSTEPAVPTAGPSDRRGIVNEVLVAGIDSSTQSTKVLLVRAADGVIVDQASAPHPNGTEVDPQLWWEALQQAGSGLLERASAIAVGGQQHGMVALDGAGAVVRPALLWNDLRSAPQIAEVVEHLGGPAELRRDDRFGAGGVVHRHQAALDGAARTGQRRAHRRGAAAARLADLDVGRRARISRADDHRSR